MSIRFDHQGCLADQAVIRRKHRPKTTDKIDESIDNAAGNSAVPALCMFTALLRQPWHGLSYHQLSNNLKARISFSRFCGSSLDHEGPDNYTIWRFTSTFRLCRIISICKGEGNETFNFILPRSDLLPDDKLLCRLSV
jgi:IS5 family transposase